LPAFKSGGRCVARFSKENCSSATYLPDFKTGEVAPCQFSKALGATLRHSWCPIGAKDLNSPVLKRFQQIQKLLGLNG
jgi:hypothetical protein